MQKSISTSDYGAFFGLACREKCGSDWRIGKAISAEIYNPHLWVLLYARLGPRIHCHLLRSLIVCAKCPSTLAGNHARFLSDDLTTTRPEPTNMEAGAA